MLSTAVGCLAADRVYQTGRLLDVGSQPYTRDIPINGGTMSVLRHENDLSVQVGDVIYVGQCEEKKHFSSCRPGNWIVGDAIDVRIDAGSMYLKKPDGGEVKTRIVKRMRAN
jgi:hypothetical protein